MEFIQGFLFPHEFYGIDLNSILIGLSGGADSVLLTIMLHKYASEKKTELYAAHLNHMIRGKEADRDQMFCAELCQRLGIKLFTKRVDIPQLCISSGRGLETEARNARYAYFASLMKEHGIATLAVAHNANDNLETVIFNLARGSGLGGMCGIPPRRKFGSGHLIRPLITCEKADIVAFCQKNGIEYVTDSTNGDIEYSRNRIRRNIVPELLSLYPTAVKSALRLSEIAREGLDFINSEAVSFIESNSSGENGNINAGLIGKLHPAAAKRVIQLLAEKHYEAAAKAQTADGERNMSLRVDSLESCHLCDILQLCVTGVEHSSISLPGGISAEIKDGCLSFSPTDEIKKTRKSEKAATYEYANEYIMLHEGDNIFNCFCISVAFKPPFENNIPWDNDKKTNVYNSNIYLVLAFDRIKGNLYARSRRPGDVIKRAGISKRVKDIMREAGVPSAYRTRLPLICSDDGILGIPGIRGAVRQGFGRKDSEIKATGANEANGEKKTVYISVREYKI